MVHMKQINKINEQNNQQKKLKIVKLKQWENEYRSVMSSRLPIGVPTK